MLKFKKILFEFEDYDFQDLEFKGGSSLGKTKPLDLRKKNIQAQIYNVKPGLTGIGSIIFRDEESLISSISDEDPHAYYNRVIAPYKGGLELWYQQNSSFTTDFKILFITAYVVVFPSNLLVYKVFKDLPTRKF